MLYFDNAATTKMSDKAISTYIESCQTFYNPSALYEPAADAKERIDTARDFFLRQLKGIAKSSFIFTGSASEANNAVLNSCLHRKDKKYLIGAGEHSSIYVTAQKYKEAGFDIQFIPLKPNGSVDASALKGMLDERVSLVSIIHVSNETGAVNDIKELSKIVKNFNPSIIFHSDGVQALGKLDINLKDLGVDYYTISAHKINGPKGIGGLYIANPNKFKSFILGGGQEQGLRAGTENFQSIMAFKTALENLKIHDFSAHKQALLAGIKEDHILVSDNDCVDNIISICFSGVRGETVQHMLEREGYLIGTGSACNSKLAHNHVLSNIVSPK